MTKLPDEKLIDKIMEDIEKSMVDRHNIIRPILQKHLTHPTDEGIEPLNENIIQLYDSVRFGTAGDNVDEFIRHVYMKLGNHLTNVEGIEKPTIHYTTEDVDAAYYRGIQHGITQSQVEDEEVKPPTKDTIEKIDRIDGDTMPDTIPNIYTTINKINELVDTVSHQQEQIQQLLSGK